MRRRTRRTRKTARRQTHRRTSKKGAFGGYKINFRGCNVPLVKIFGNRPLAPSAMTKKLWQFVKRRKLYSY